MDRLQKEEYINKDFKQKVVSPLGNMPSVKKQADKWFMEFIKLQSEFLTRYKENSMFDYAKKISLAFGDQVEDEYRVKFS